jgi:hypothetical protein
MKKWLNPMLGVTLGTLIAWISVSSVDSLIYRSLSVNRWFEVGELLIDDVSISSGQSPNIRLVQQVKKPFTATWTVTFRKRLGDEFAVFCTRHGRADYRPRTAVPERTDLNWLMEIPANPPCDGLGLGQYMVTVVWIVENEGYPPKVARVESNVFEVKA